MRSCRRMILLLLAALAPAPAIAQEAKPVPAGMTARLLATMDRVTDAGVSPDGRWIAYVVRTVSPDLGRISTHIMLADQDRPAAPHIALAGAPAKQDMPTWSADGRTLYFRGPDQAGIAQIWRIGVDSAAAVQLTRMPIDVGAFQLSPDDRFVVASFRVYPDCPTLDCTVARAAKPSVGTLYTKLNVRFYDSYGDGRYNGLFKLALDGGQPPVPLMPGFESDVPTRPLGTATSFAISPDGKTLIFSARPSGVTPNLSTVHRLFQLSLDAPSAPREIGSDQPGSHLNPIVSPDGKLLAYMDKADVGSDGDRAIIRVRNLATGDVRALGLPVDRWPNEIAWSADGRSVLARSDDDGRERLYAYHLSGKVERLPVDGVSGMAVSSRGLVLTLSSFARPQQLFVATAQGRSMRRVTDVGAAQLAGVPMAPTHSLTFKGWNDEPVQAFVTEPLNRVPGQRYPVIFVIHGGPHGVYQDEWELRPQPAALGRPGLRHDHGQLPRLDRFRPGLRTCRDRSSRRSRAGGSAEGLGRGARRISLHRRQSRLRNGQFVRRVHDQLDRGGVERTMALPDLARRQFRLPWLWHRPAMAQ
jgi:dipeptidyl aminopeptidase/acylaminoacyl peptidase